MNKISLKFYGFIFLLSALIATKSYGEIWGGPFIMPAPQIFQFPAHPKNLQGISFTEKPEIESIVDELAKSAKDPYNASLPLIASAGLGDAGRYQIARTQMLAMLDTLNQTPATYATWMQSNSFKAWMQGRVLLAANNMSDDTTLTQTKNKLSLLLKEKMAKEDSFAFYAWAKGYDAALDQTEYSSFKYAAIDETMQLSAKYKSNPTDHGALSDALWAWVMDLSAAANAGDQQNYELIKEQMKWLTDAKSVTQALETGLLRTADSNDYPAWAMAKVRLAAAIMGDTSLYQEINDALISSIANAKKAGAKAEYVLAVIDNQLAMH